MPPKDCDRDNACACISSGDYANCKCSVPNYITKNLCTLAFGRNKKNKTKFRSGLADSSSLQEEGHLVPKGTPIS